MIGIVVVTHGRLAQEFLDTVKLIMGEQKDVTAVNLTAGDSLDALRERIATAIEPFKTEGCLILTDLLGGSPANVCVELIKNDWIRVLCGVNLPMVMAAANLRSTLDLTALSAKVRDGAAKGIVDLKSFYEERTRKK
jgi:PTS system mannose-specific IIA component